MSSPVKKRGSLKKLTWALIIFIFFIVAAQAFDENVQTTLGQESSTESENTASSDSTESSAGANQEIDVTNVNDDSEENIYVPIDELAAESVIDENLKTDAELTPQTEQEHDEEFVYIPIEEITLEDNKSESEIDIVNFAAAGADENETMLEVTEGNETIQEEVINNTAPIVNAGGDIIIIYGQNASLDSSASDDGLPSTNLSFSWSAPSGPGLVGFSNSYSSDTTATFSAAGNYTLRLEVDDGDLSSNDEILVRVVMPVNETPNISFNVNKQDVTTSENVTFSITMNSEVNRSIFYSLDFNDGTAFHSFSSPSANHVSVTVSHRYILNKTYSPELTFVFNGVPVVRSLNIIVRPNSSLTDNILPEIEMTHPADNSEINKNSVNFSFNAKDNVALSNCTYNLYSYSSLANGSTILGTLINTRLYSQIGNYTNISYLKEGLIDGEYSWDIECTDTSGNYNTKEREFRVISDVDVVNVSVLSQNDANTPYDKQEVVENLSDAINNYFDEESNLNGAEKEVIEDLGLTMKMIAYKRQLVQMKLDLQHNLNHVIDTNTREKRRQEILSELEKMKQDIPIRIRVIESSEYSKNTPSNSIEEITSAYVLGRNMALSEREVRILAQRNSEMQNSMIYSTRAKQVELEYLESKKEITLVTKTFKLKNTSESKILEYIPKEISSSAKEITFLAENEIVQDDPLIELDINDLEEGKFAYYIPRLVSLKDIEKTDSILFKEFDVLKGSGLIGLSIFDSDVLSSVSIIWVIIPLAAVILMFGSLQFVNYMRIKNEPEIKEIMMLVRGAGRALEEKDVERAKRDYYEIKDAYARLSANGRKFLFKDIKELQIHIDKKEMAILIKKCLVSIKENRHEDVVEQYGKIKQIYSRLPKKYQEKVYKNILPYLNSAR